MKSKSLLAVSVFLGGVVGCASSPAPEEQQGRQEQAMARRIDEICAMPEAQREAELERLKKEAGFVLYCGKEKN